MSFDENEKTAETAVSENEESSRPARKEWTIMVYMAGDNNLSEDMITALAGIKSGVKAGLDHIAARGGDLKDFNGIQFFAQYDCAHPVTPTRRYDLSTIGADPEPVPDDELKHTGEAIDFFVKWCLNKQPDSKNYALVLSGHSDAFQGRTLLVDDDPSSILTIKELKDCLCQAKDRLPKKKFDILGFDSCVMNTLEVMYEFRDAAEIWIGSQGSIPNYTWDYQSIARELVKLPNTELSARNIVDVTVGRVKSYNEVYNIGGRSIDISACYLNDGLLNRLVDAIDSLAALLLRLITTNYEYAIPEFTQNYNFVQRLLIHNHWRCQNYMFDQAADIRDFCFCLKKDCLKIIAETFELCGVEVGGLFQNEPLGEEEIVFINTASENTRLSEKARKYIAESFEIYERCERVISAVGHLVIQGAYSGMNYQFSKGVSMFLPWALLAFRMTREKYTDLDFNKLPNKSHWQLFIIHYLVLTSRFDPKIIPYLKTSLDSESFGVNLDKQTLELLVKFIETLGNKDFPPHSRGLEQYVNYFGRVKNVLPWLEVSGDFS